MRKESEASHAPAVCACSGACAQRCVLRYLGTCCGCTWKAERLPHAGVNAPSPILWFVTGLVITHLHEVRLQQVLCLQAQSVKQALEILTCSLHHPSCPWSSCWRVQGQVHPPLVRLPHSRRSALLGPTLPYAWRLSQKNKEALWDAPPAHHGGQRPQGAAAPPPPLPPQ